MIGSRKSNSLFNASKIGEAGEEGDKVGAERRGRNTLCIKQEPFLISQASVFSFWTHSICSNSARYNEGMKEDKSEFAEFQEEILLLLKNKIHIY